MGAIGSLRAGGMHCDDSFKRLLLLLNGEETAGGESEGRETNEP